MARHIWLAKHGIEDLVLDVDAEERSAGAEIYDADDVHDAFATSDLVEHLDGDRVEFSVVGLDSGNGKGVLLEQAAPLYRETVNDGDGPLALHGLPDGFIAVELAGSRRQTDIAPVHEPIINTQDGIVIPAAARGVGDVDFGDG